MNPHNPVKPSDIPRKAFRATPLAKGIPLESIVVLQPVGEGNQFRLDSETHNDSLERLLQEGTLSFRTEDLQNLQVIAWRELDHVLTHGLPRKIWILHLEQIDPLE